MIIQYRIINQFFLYTIIYKSFKILYFLYIAQKNLTISYTHWITLVNNFIKNVSLIKS